MKRNSKEYKQRQENIKELRKLVTRANTRLRSLEDKGMTNKSNAYRYIRDNRTSVIFGTDSKGRIKFRTDIASLTSDEFASVKREVNKFLEAKTSTPTGIIKSEIKRYETFKRKKWISKDITFEQFEGLMNDTIEKIYQKYGSTNVQAYSKSDLTKEDDWKIIEEMVKAELQYTMSLNKFMEEFKNRKKLPDEEKAEGSDDFSNDNFNKQFEE